MGFNIENKDETGLLYARGVELDLLEWLKTEASRKGYSVGEYLNRVLSLARDFSDKEKRGKKNRNTIR